jgi:hypothetical protein
MIFPPSSEIKRKPSAAIATPTIRPKTTLALGFGTKRENHTNEQALRTRDIQGIAQQNGGCSL